MILILIKDFKEPSGIFPRQKEREAEFYTLTVKNDGPGSALVTWNVGNLPGALAVDHVQTLAAGEFFNIARQEPYAIEELRIVDNTGSITAALNEVWS